MPRLYYPTAGDLRAALLAAGITPTAALEGQLWSMAPAGVQAFERQVRRKMLAPATPVAVTFDPPTDREGLLFIDDLASTDETGTAIYPTLGYQPQGATLQPWTLGTQYRLEPANAVSRGRPYTRLRLFGQIWMQPLAWSLGNAVSVTGRWGWGCLVPDDAWEACLAAGLLERWGMIAHIVAGGVVKWQRGDASNQYEPKPLSGFREDLEKTLKAAVTTYRRVDLG